MAPGWMYVLALLSFFYAFVNFFLFMMDGDSMATAAIRNGQFILESRGQFIRNITEVEYYHYKAAMVRGFSGHWMLFYGWATAGLYPYNPTNNEVSKNS